MARKKQGSYAKVNVYKDHVIKKPLNMDINNALSIIREKEYLEYLKDCEHVINMAGRKGFNLKLEKGKVSSSLNDVYMDRGEYVSQLLDAIGEIHSKGIVHNDIKGGNIVHVDGVVKLIDFGISFPMTRDLHPLNLLGLVQDKDINYGQTNTYIDDYRCLDEMLKGQGCEPIDYTLRDITPNFNPPKPELPECKKKISKVHLNMIPCDQLARAQLYDQHIEAFYTHYQAALVYEEDFDPENVKKLIEQKAPLEFYSYHYNVKDIISKYC